MAALQQAANGAGQLTAGVWSGQAEKQFHLLPLSAQEHSNDRQAAWQAYVMDRSQAQQSDAEHAQAIAAVLRDGVTCTDDIDGILQGSSMLDVIKSSVSAALAASPHLTVQDKVVLQNSVVNLMLHINQEDATATLEDLEARTAHIIIRLYSPISTHAVDVQMEYHFRLRYSLKGHYLEYYTDVSYALVDAAEVSGPLPQSEGDAWKLIFSLFQDDYDPRLEPEDAPWVYNPVRECYLTPEQLHMIRSHLFGGAASAAAPLSSRLTDFDLAQLLMCCTGAQWDGITPERGPLTLTPDGWLEHHLRELCGCQRPQDAERKPTDYEGELLSAIGIWVATKRPETVARAVLQRIRTGRFSAEDFMQDPPKGYMSGDPRGD